MPCPGVPLSLSRLGEAGAGGRFGGPLAPTSPTAASPWLLQKNHNHGGGSPEAKAKDALSTVETPAWHPKHGWEGNEASQTETIPGRWEEQGQSPPWPDPSVVMTPDRMDPTLAGPLTTVMDTKPGAKVTKLYTGGTHMWPLGPGCQGSGTGNASSPAAPPGKMG